MSNKHKSGLIAWRGAGVFLTLILVLVAVVAAITISSCGGDLPQGAVAQVGERLVAQDQFDKLMAAYEATDRAPDKDKQKDEYQDFERRVAEYLVDMEVLRQEAAAQKVRVSEEEVQTQVAQIKEMFRGDQEEFDAALKAQNLTAEQFTESIRDRLLLDEMKAAVTKSVAVTEDEAKAYYEAHKSDFVQQEKREARHILIAPVKLEENGTMSTTPTQADWDAAKSEAERVRSEILNGADFITEVEKYSDDVSTSGSEGQLGLITKGQMVPAFEDAVFSLNKNELSEPVKTQYGYHLIEVTDIIPEEQLSYDQVKENIKSTLLDEKQSVAWEQWLTDRKAKLGVVYRGGLEPISGGSGATETSTTSSTSE